MIALNSPSLSSNLPQNVSSVLTCTWSLTSGRSGRDTIVVLLITVRSPKMLQIWYMNHTLLSVPPFLSRLDLLQGVTKPTWRETMSLLSITLPLRLIYLHQFNLAPL